MNEGIIIYGVPDDPNNDRAYQAIRKLTGVNVSGVICPPSVRGTIRVPFITDEQGRRHFGVEGIERFISRRLKTQINTKTDAIRELKHLLKPRIYHIRIWGNQGICLTAKWGYDVSIDIYIEDETITKEQTKHIFTLQQVQADLSRFKSAIDCLCNTTTILAQIDKQKKQLKSRLTKAEDQAYFEKLLDEARK